MTRYLLDTNHAGALLRDNEIFLNRIRQAQDSAFGLCMPSIGELWHMVFNSLRQASNEQKLQRVLSAFAIHEFDHRAAKEFGKLLTDLRRAGRPIPSIDIQIAAIALANDLVLLTADQHFQQVPNLRIENWLD